ncbi:TetR/AcrR family transcriptional regulator [Mesorhizobium sp. 1B3]|uniref:TetR/AcrR family transcriptional regulator n=1 Tax=Mesorhizobium sp. 1B3 TaxID=3243599 RepID=UPI003D99F2DA
MVGRSTSKQIERRKRIEDAAYAVLCESGYKSTSLLSVARQASASNETLYNWYGNKQGLFRSLIEENAREARKLLSDALTEAHDPLATVWALGPILLALVTSNRAVALNRAAAADVAETHSLGPSISELGRETIRPLLSELLGRAAHEGLIACTDPDHAVDIYFRLLIGDLQIRRVIGVLPELTPTEIEERAEGAMILFVRLFAPTPTEFSRERSE